MGLVLRNWEKVFFEILGEISLPNGSKAAKCVECKNWSGLHGYPTTAHNL
jgi:hypothetical protein